MLLLLFLWQYWEEETVWLIFSCWWSSELVLPFSAGPAKPSDVGVHLPAASTTNERSILFEGGKAEASAIFCASYGALEMEKKCNENVSIDLLL